MVDIAIVGAGGIASRHVEALREVPGARIVAVVDVAEDRARAIAATCGAEPYAELRECLAQVDLVYILTPPYAHREPALEAMAAGKHVVCEKPIASSVEDAEAMVAAAHSAGVKLMIAFNMRFRRGFRLLKDAVQAGTLGQVVSYWGQRLGVGIGEGYSWRTDPNLLCGMSVESLSHDIDLIRWIAGEISDVRANVFASRPGLPGFDDNANAVFSLANGGTAVIHASWSSHLGVNSRGVVGTRGTALVEGPGLWELRRFHLKTADMENASISVIDDPFDVHSYIAESRHFIDCVEHDLQPTIAGEDGLKALRISHAILRSHRDKRVVSMA